MIVTDDRVGKFIAESLDFPLCPPFVAVGLECDGKIVAGVLLNHFEGADIHLTATGKGWTREFLREIGIYVFKVLECQRMTMITESEAVAKLGERLGGRREGVLRSHFGYGRDGIIIGVLKDEYRWYKMA